MYTITMKYVIFLRGINVGRKNIINMTRLKKCLETTEFKNISTYINSGNIILEDETHSKEQIIEILNSKIQENFSLNVPAIIRNQKQIKQITSKIPSNWVNNNTMRTDILLLWPSIDSKDTVNDISINPEVDNVLYLPEAIVWNLKRDHYRQSKIHKLIGTKIYKLMTIRNVNTIRKLNDLCNQ